MKKKQRETPHIELEGQKGESNIEENDSRSSHRTAINQKDKKGKWPRIANGHLNTACLSLIIFVRKRKYQLNRQDMNGMMETENKLITHNFVLVRIWIIVLFLFLLVIVLVDVLLFEEATGS